MDNSYYQSKYIEFSFHGNELNIMNWHSNEKSLLKIPNTIHFILVYLQI